MKQLGRKANKKYIHDLYEKDLYKLKIYIYSPEIDPHKWSQQFFDKEQSQYNRTKIACSINQQMLLEKFNAQMSNKQRIQTNILHASQKLFKMDYTRKDLENNRNNPSDILFGDDFVTTVSKP